MRSGRRNYAISPLVRGLLFRPCEEDTLIPTPHTSIAIPLRLALSLALGLALGIGVGCGQDPNAGTAAITQAAVAALTPVAVVAAPILGPTASAVGDGWKTAVEAGARDSATGDGGASPGGGDRQPAGSNTCYGIHWNGLSATISYMACTLGPGLSLNGQVIVGLTTNPKGVEIEFDNLTLGAVALDGTVSAVSSTSPAGAGATIDGKLTYQGSGGVETLALDRVDVRFSAGQATLNGNGTVTTASESAAVTATQLVQKVGDCIASSGTIAFEQPTGLATVTFLTTTPSDGKVSVQVGSAPPALITVRTPCSSEK
jgi:hypothetical protein